MLPPPAAADSEVTIMSYLRYFANIWLLGIKMMFKVLVGWIMIVLMLGIPAFLLQFIPGLPLPSEEARQVVALIAMGVYFFVIVPVAFYVGGSTVGFCPWISAATFAQKKENEG